MKRIKELLLLFFIISFTTHVFAKEVPKSFADLAEKLMPSVVNISTTTTVVTNTNPFKGFEFVVIVCVVEILTTDGINFSARSAKEDGIFAV